MNALIASEFLKLRTTRTFFGITGAGLGLLLLITGLAAALADWDSEATPFTSLLSGSSFIAIFALVIGILAISTEFRHNTVTPSLLASPDRTRWAVSKLVANTLAGGLFGLVTVGAISVVVLVIFAARGISPGIDVGELAQIVLGTTLAAGLMAALGVGLGAIIRNQAGAIVVALVYLFVLESLIGGLIPGASEPVSKYGITGLLGGVSGVDDTGDALSQVPAGLLLFAYALVFLAAGIALLRRRDVSGG